MTVAGNMQSDYLPEDNDPTIKNTTPAADQTLRASAAPWSNSPPPPTVSAPSQAPRVENNYTAVPLPPPPITTPIRQSPARDRMRRRRVNSRRNRGSEWAWVIVAAALLGVVIIVSMSAFLVLRVSDQQAEIIPTAVAVLPTPVDARSDFNQTNTSFGIGDQVTLSDGSNIVLQPWDGQSRFTVLLMGLDRRPGETGLAYRTDTMMLVSLDPVTDSIGILSIPRDLFVDVPGYGQLQRVNSPMVLGELQRPGFGPQLAMQTVQRNLGIRVHEYMAVDFDAFVTVVDAIGGIEIEVPRTINDPRYPDMFFGFDPFFVEAGVHQFDGLTALKYARTRHDSSDFERAQRQQQVLYAVRDRVLNFNALPQLIIQAPRMWSSLNDNIYSGLSLDQIIQLGLFLKDIPSENIHAGVIDSRYTFNYQTPQGAAVLVPDRARLGPLMVDVFGQSYSQ